MTEIQSNVKILVVDDEMGIRELLSYELGSKGYQVTTANNGQEALEKLSQGKFQLIISDVKMPKLGGVEFLDTVKKIAPDIEVILATGFGTIETAVDAMKKGAFDFIQKPFNLVDIFSLIEKALDRSELKTLMGVYEASKIVFSTDKLDTLLLQIALLCKKTVKANDVMIYLCADTNNPSIISTEYSDPRDRDIRADTCKQLLIKTPDWNQALLINGINNINSSIFFPLIIENKIIGVFNLNRTDSKDSFSNTDLISVPLYGTQITQVFHNVQMYEKLNNKVGELTNTIKKLEETEQQLIHSDKLATIGKMTAGVIHDLNNPLNGILLSAQLFLDNDGLTEEQKEDLNIIVNQSKHCNEVIQNLLQFSGKRTPKQDTLQIGQLVEMALKMLKHDLEGSQVNVTCSIPEDLPNLVGDPTQLSQVILNLINNARQAMKDSLNKTILIKAEKKSTSIELQIKDSGSGIAPENISKIFEPFFTTKPIGEGTGLGLSICKDVVERFGGSIKVESQLGIGTSFNLSFPINVNTGAHI
ncbi:MAG: response regulator [Elusimicrobiota bacterium]